MMTSDLNDIGFDEVDEELWDYEVVLNRIKERLWDERQFKNPVMHVDALSMCFLFPSGNSDASNEQRNEVLDFLVEHFFPTNLGGQMKLNSRFKNIHDRNGGLLSCMKRNVFDIEEAQANEFLISTEPFMFVILKDDVEELKTHLKQKVMSLIFDEHWEDTGMAPC